MPPADEKDNAFAWLEKTIDEREPAAVQLKIDPQYVSLRSDPRYPTLLNENDTLTGVRRLIAHPPTRVHYESNKRSRESFKRGEVLSMPLSSIELQ